MSERSKDPAQPPSAPAKKPMLLLTHLQFPTEYGFLLAVNMVDLFMTMLFIERGGGEVNPLAKWILLAGGKSGFILYKVVLVLLVIMNSSILGRLVQPLLHFFLGLAG